MSLTKPESTPVPERSLNRQAVLEEEEYTEALSQIIARDFFPSLVHLDATNEYLDALQTRDAHLINASVRRLEEISYTPARSSRPRVSAQTPTQTPYGLASETPLRSVHGEPLQKRARYDTDLSLDTFQARYTSEDNSSFTQILDEENRIRKEKWAWAWEAQKRVERQHEKMIEKRETMLLEAPKATGVKEKFTIELPKPAGLITDGEKGEKTDIGGGQMTVAIEQDSMELEPYDVMAPLKDTRSAGVDGWKFKTRNSLMFAPDADVSPYDPPHSNRNKDEPVPKVVNYANTRLSEHEHTVGDSRSASAPPSPTRSRIDAAITGTPYRPRSPGGEQRFSLVANLPSPTPAELGPNAMKQLMTWGTLHSTPRIISQSDGPAEMRTPFHIPDISSREAISHKLSNNASKSLRVKAEMFGTGLPIRTPRSVKILSGKKGGMAPPSWTPRRSEAAGSLTPAARRLLERSTMGGAAARRAEAMERTAGWEGSSKGKERELDRVRWTPTPSPVTRR
ncbi:nuclear protein DGCR14 [Crassisporium funariophilum]|nr:nuclear protein DGCR14 [Crassisporium funariophilum]